ncbi:MAG: MFS transporter [Thermoprotei archaeon]
MSAPIKINKTIVLVLVCLGVAYFSYAIDRFAFSFLVPNVSAAFSIPLSLSGLLGTIFLYGQIAGSVPAGFFLSRYGYKYTLSVGIGVATLGVFLTAAAINTTFVLVARILTGIGEGFWSVSIVLTLANIFASRRGIGVGISQNFFGVGLFFGPFLAGLILNATNLWRDVFYIFGVIGSVGTLLIVLVVKRRYTDPEKADAHALNTHHESAKDKLDLTIFRSYMTYIPVVLLALYEVTFWGWTISVSSYLENVLRFNVVTAGFLAGADGISILGLSWLAGYFGDRFNRRWAFAVGGVVQGVVAVIAYSTFPGFYSFLCLALLFGFFTIMIYVAIFAHISETFRKKDASVVTGITFGVGLVFAGSIGKIMFDFISRFGWSAASVYLIGIPSFAMAVLGLLFIRPVTHSAELPGDGLEAD